MLHCLTTERGKKWEIQSLRLPKKLQEELDIVAKTEKTSRSEIIRDAITRYLAVKRFQ
ncbi:ribbon-helix-helix domain-containing protein [Candidatus Acetothermia bacterium]|nr:ribbon-helix-helix domain-containing protein [Candidatus Acetothermia bacterium]MCI2427745.1 ribbon-helix-helix domain-containing protein [Candidatus Acetothermia bacterium]MCI2428048.1 ribbon-helix-helix domain-containing protein [Candidatus Acetothermia bacterium]